MVLVGYRHQDARHQPVARELAPAGARSGPKTSHRAYSDSAIIQIESRHRFYGCFATEREQAPSPQFAA
ncbi:hypothetical protein BK661_01660 [Pseudomonas frederiksbergensis]|uniref:Uncharacterized protein n=1 Tax=Pseudomonas frederiksbergensis TaxID=104087 RepID=A0A423JHC1_9PSED|nr:hypothetical protein BK661_01660 [Pseudomonas frederiksbergensis]